MEYKKSEERLLMIFKENNFLTNIQAGNFHASQKRIGSCDNRTLIFISFPGYKAEASTSKIIYDYRVDICKDGITTALSHTNIITDIFNKIKNGGMSANNLKEVLIEIAKEGEIDFEAIVDKLEYNPIIPPQTLIEKVRLAHGNKKYNHEGNLSDLTIEELLKCLKWIVLQEDINYPIAQNYEGRKMPFSRYLETIFITQNSSHDLEEVISRALIHTRPKPWSDMDYSFTQLIK